MVTSHVVPTELSGNRLDHVLRRLFPDTPRRLLLTWLLQGSVKVDGRLARKGQVVVAGQELTVTGPEPASDPGIAPFQLSILFESDDVVVLDKPAGQPSSSLAGGASHSVAALLRERYPQTANIGHGPNDAGLIHRLDTGTSGALVAAKTKDAFAHLTSALRNGDLHKVYLAWTGGSLPNGRGSIELPLRTDPRNQRRVIAAIGRHRASHPVHVTHYEQLASNNGITLVRVHAPVATRHQIRAHLASVGCPLIGDVLYGGPTHSNLTRHALHALQVVHRGAVACSPFDCTASPPEDLRRLLPFGLTD